jgi:hypothetical protein
MLVENNSIILVDDSQEDLGRLTSIFAQRGIGCRSFQYDGIEFPESPLGGVKMVFMDINLSNSGDENSQFAVLEEALRNYIAKENSYFVLVFWTTHIDYIGRFKEFVNRDPDNANDLPKPMLITAVDKTQFVDNNVALEDKLSQIFEEKLVKCLFSFDDNIQIAANKCLTDIVNLAPFNDRWGSNSQFETNMRNLFTKIAIGSLGLKPAKENPDKAIKEVIAPSFLYDLTEIKQNMWKDFLEMDGRTDEELARITFAGDNTSAKLNTILNIDPSTEETEARGSVRKLKMDEDAKGYFKNAFAVSVEDFIKNKMVSVTDNAFVNEATVVAVEISAACDYSNDKPRLHRYMLGIFAKRKDFDDHVSKRKTELMGNHLLITPFDFVFENEICCMVFNLNYTFNEEVTELFSKLGDKIFGFKSEFMNSISNNYARHISRIGYASFK